MNALFEYSHVYSIGALFQQLSEIHLRRGFQLNEEFEKLVVLLLTNQK